MISFRALVFGRLVSSTDQRWSDAVAISDGLLQHAPELLGVDIALATGDHHGAIVAKIAPPLRDLIVAAGALVLADLFIRDAIDVRAQVDAGLVRTLVHERLLLKIPDGLLHSAKHLTQSFGPDQIQDAYSHLIKSMI